MENVNVQEEIYVGRYGLTKDVTFENVIIDWRAPIASLFYKGSLGPATYKTPDGELPADILARRQFVIKKGSLQGYFDSEVDVKDEILQMILSSNSGIMTSLIFVASSLSTNESDFALPVI